MKSVEPQWVLVTHATGIVGRSLVIRALARNPTSACLRHLRMQHALLRRRAMSRSSSRPEKGML